MNGTHSIKTHRKTAKGRKTPRGLVWHCRALVFFASLTLFAPAHAACLSPAGVESQTRYDFTAHKMYYCDGTEWVGMRGETLQFVTVGGWTTAACPAGYSVLTCNGVAHNSAGNLVCGTGMAGTTCTASCSGGPYYATATCYR